MPASSIMQQVKHIHIDKLPSLLTFPRDAISGASLDKSVAARASVVNYRFESLAAGFGGRGGGLAFMQIAPRHRAMNHYFLKYATLRNAKRWAYVAGRGRSYEGNFPRDFIRAEGKPNSFCSMYDQ